MEYASICKELNPFTGENDNYLFCTLKNLIYKINILNFVIYAWCKIGLSIWHCFNVVRNTADVRVISRNTGQ